MLNELLARYAGVPVEEIDRWLSMSAAEIYRDTDFLTAVGQLDRHLLDQTMLDAHSAFERHLPEFRERMSAGHPQVDVTRMTAYTLSNWLVGFLQYPEMFYQLLELHQRIPADFMRQYVPELLAVLDRLEVGRAEWQRAFTLLCLPMMAES